MDGRPQEGPPAPRLESTDRRHNVAQFEVARDWEAQRSDGRASEALLNQPKGGLSPEEDVEWVRPPLLSGEKGITAEQAAQMGPTAQKLWASNRTTWRDPQPNFSQQHIAGIGGEAIKPTDEHRWPEGFDPARRDDVAGRVRIVQHNAARGHLNDEVHPWSDTRGNETPGRMHNLGKQRVIAAIARSSVPIEEIRHPQDDPENQNFARQPIVTGDNDPTMVGAAGWFHPTYGSVHMRHGSRRMNDDNALADTLLHEMGHANSHYNTTPHSPRAEIIAGRQGDVDQLPGTTASRQGAEEAYADNYAIQHRGGRRGEELPKYTTPYDAPMSFQRAYGLSENEARTAHSAYRENRMPVAEVHRRPGAIQQAGSDQFREIPLFGRNADAIRTRTEKDFGQFGWFSNAERSGPSMESIRLGQGPPERSQEIMQPGHRVEDVDLIAGHSSHLQHEYLTAVERGDTKKAADAVKDAKARDKERW